MRSPDPLAAMMGLLLRGGEEPIYGGKGTTSKRDGTDGREGAEREGEEIPPPANSR